MELRFWGVRGSIAVPGEHTLRVGGNTTCISVYCHNYLFVFDAGTGIRQLGQHIEKSGLANVRGSIFFTHYHWDHIQGLPFFYPARRPNNRFHLYGERKSGVDMEEILRQQMQDPYFPIEMTQQHALVTFETINAGDTIHPVEGASIKTIRLNHPNDSLGFRLEAPDGSLCLITDHEHPDGGLDQDVVEFAKGVDVLIHEGQYHPDEKTADKAGWGHSSWREAALTAKQANVGKLFITHHDPERSDDDVFEIEKLAQEIFPNTEVACENKIWSG